MKKLASSIKKWTLLWIPEIIIIVLNFIFAAMAAIFYFSSQPINNVTLLPTFFDDYFKNLLLILTIIGTIIFFINTFIFCVVFYKNHDLYLNTHKLLIFGHIFIWFMITILSLFVSWNIFSLNIANAPDSVVLDFIKAYAIIAICYATLCILGAIFIICILLIPKTILDLTQLDSYSFKINLIKPEKEELLELNEKELRDSLDNDILKYLNTFSKKITKNDFEYLIFNYSEKGYKNISNALVAFYPINLIKYKRIIIYIRSSKKSWALSGHKTFICTLPPMQAKIDLSKLELHLDVGSVKTESKDLNRITEKEVRNMLDMDIKNYLTKFVSDIENKDFIYSILTYPDNDLTKSEMAEFPISLREPKRLVAFVEANNNSTKIKGNKIIICHFPVATFIKKYKI